MFRRRRKEQAETTDEAVQPSDELLDADEAGETDAGPAEDGVTDTAELDDAEAIATPALRSGPSPDAPAGPFDVADAPDDDVPRVDLGALRVPIVSDVELRLEVDDQGQLGQVLLVEGANIMQIGAFAAPKTSGIWDDVRAEILGSLSTGGGEAEEVEGLYGVELAARLPTGTPGQLAPARFLGIDRRRWFVRALLSGPAALDPEAAVPLLSVLAGTVVVRGDDAMPIRDPLPLRLPKEAVDAAEAEAAAGSGADGADDGAGDGDGDGAEGKPGLDRLGPGPTITETR